MQTAKDLESLKQIAGVFQALFLSPEGQKAIEHLKLRFFHSRTTLAISATSGRVDPERTLFNEGCRFVIEYIDGLINQDIAAIEDEIKRIEAPPKSDDLAT